MQKILSAHDFGDIRVVYSLDQEKEQVGLILFPTVLSDQLAVRHSRLNGLPDIDLMTDAGRPAVAVNSLVQIKILGDPYSGPFAQGHTMRQASSINRFRFDKQTCHDEDGIKQVVTTLKSPEGLLLEHLLSWRTGDRALEVATRFENASRHPVTLEMLSSFSLSRITPFDDADASGRLLVHRFRSLWSAEGRLETRSMENLHLEPSWTGDGLFSERFGQVGSLPVRKWFPFVAIEDTTTGVVWGAQLAWAGSWQMEIFRQHDDVCLSGGLADREFGHWMKTLQPGEALESPTSILSCVRGTLDDVCDRLTEMQQRAADQQPSVESQLPIIFNEYCTSWGDPRHDLLVNLVDRLKGTDTRYLVIDAGWYKSDGTSWSMSHGDWKPSSRLFPQGIEATARAIRERGLIPGLWFEMETCGEASTAFSIVDHLLQRDALPLTTNKRRFWNLNDPWTVDYLTTRVIDLLERGGFGYVKIDYNETIGLGCDHPDSLGEGLRQQTLGTYRFFKKIRERLPNLVIESCASGGHRLEPSMLALSSMSSFSDAHELVEIPIIAANLHRLVLPRQSQIWAVLHKSDTKQRLIYSLAAAFLGRMCLSGKILDLQDIQWQIVLEAQRLYKAAVPIIKHGISRRFGQIGESWRHPQGWQAIRRVSVTGESILIVIHAFARAPKIIHVPLPRDSWMIVGQLGDLPVSFQENDLVLHLAEDFVSIVILLRRTNFATSQV